MISRVRCLFLDRSVDVRWRDIQLLQNAVENVEYNLCLAPILSQIVAFEPSLGTIYGDCSRSKKFSTREIYGIWNG